MFSIIGLAVVVGAILGGYLLEHGNVKALLQPAELIIIGGAAVADDAPTGVIKPLSSVKFSVDNDVKCLLSAVESGDPAKGRSTSIVPSCEQS